MPLVAPTKRATRGRGKVVEIRELEARIEERDTIFKGYQVVLFKIVSVLEKELLFIKKYV